MSNVNAIVRARIDASTKEEAITVLASMGLNISDAIRMLLLRIVAERRLPFEIGVPNATTKKSVEELKGGRGKKFESSDALFKDLGI